METQHLQNLWTKSNQIKIKNHDINIISTHLKFLPVFIPSLNNSVTFKTLQAQKNVLDSKYKFIMIILTYLSVKVQQIFCKYKFCFYPTVKSHDHVPGCNLRFFISTTDPPKGVDFSAEETYFLRSKQITCYTQTNRSAQNIFCIKFFQAIILSFLRPESSHFKTLYWIKGL